MPAGASRAGGLALGCPWPGVGTTVLSGAVCSEDGNHDEINSKSLCQQLTSHVVPFQNKLYFPGFLLFIKNFPAGLLRLMGGSDPCPVLEDSDDYWAVETHTDTTEPGPPRPQALYCGRSRCPHNRQAGGQGACDPSYR